SHFVPPLQRLPSQRTVKLTCRGRPQRLHAARNRNAARSSSAACYAASPLRCLAKSKPVSKLDHSPLSEYSPKLLDAKSYPKQNPCISSPSRTRPSSSKCGNTSSGEMGRL